MFWWIFWLVIVSAFAFWAWPTSARRRDGAIEALRRAFATGQITEEEYRRRLAILTEAPPADRPQSAVS